MYSTADSGFRIEKKIVNPTEADLDVPLASRDFRGGGRKMGILVANLPGSTKLLPITVSRKSSSTRNSVRTLHPVLCLGFV